MEKNNKLLNRSRSQDCYAIASRRHLDLYKGDVGLPVFFLPTAGFAPDSKPGFWKPDRITHNSYTSGSFRLVHIISAWICSSVETTIELVKELRRDCPEFDWTIIHYTKVEAFQEV